MVSLGKKRRLEWVIDDGRDNNQIPEVYLEFEKVEGRENNQIHEVYLEFEKVEGRESDQIHKGYLEIEKVEGRKSDQIQEGYLEFEKIEGRESVEGRERDQIHEGYSEFVKGETRNGLNFPILELETNIIYEILSRLPIRSIFACSCVCKKFFELIKDPYFARFHLTRAPATASLVFRQSSTIKWGILKFYMFDLVQGLRASTCSIDCQHGTCHTRDYLNPSIAKQNPTLWFLNKYTTVVGECNGLLCLYSNFPEHLYLICNPILGEYVSLPCSSLTKRIHSGFGYSPKSGHYKVIHFAIAARETVVVDICTLGSNSWRRIHDAPYVGFQNRRFQGSFDTLLNGCLHWITEGRKPSELLCSLDLESERFTFLPPPSHFSKNHIRKISYTNVGIFRGSLCLCYVYENNQFEVWVMKNYGVEESWSQEFSIDINYYSGLREVDFENPLKFMENGELWLHCRLNSLVSYRPQTRTFRDFDILSEFSYGVILYYPSFISLKHAVKGKNLIVVKADADKLAMIFLP